MSQGFCGKGLKPFGASPWRLYRGRAEAAVRARRAPGAMGEDLKVIAEAVRANRKRASEARSRAECIEQKIVSPSKALGKLKS